MTDEEFAAACEQELPAITEADVIAHLNEQMHRVVLKLAASLDAAGGDGSYASDSGENLAAAIYFANNYLQHMPEPDPGLPAEIVRLHRALHQAIDAYRVSRPPLLAVRRVRERLEAAEPS